MGADVLSEKLSERNDFMKQHHREEFREMNVTHSDRDHKSE